MIDTIRAALALNGNDKTAAAADLGISRHAIRRALAKAALQGDSPEHGLVHPLPEPFRVSRTTSLYRRGEAEPVLYWQQAKPDEERVGEMLRAYVEGLASAHDARAPLVPPPACVDANYLNVIPMGDPHFGLMAHAEEAGDNFDLKIADQLTRGAIDRLVESSAPARTALFINPGDFYHADDGTNKTPGHHNPVDVDGRYHKIIRTGAWCMVHCIMRLLERHQEVHVWNLPGNHDPHATPGMALALSMHFHDNPRVHIDTNPSLYRYFRFGKVLIGGHHGHGAKGAELPMVMANDCPEDWGATLYRVWHTFHVHHDSLKDFVGCTVETHRTLAAKDAWHAGKGYRSGRDMKLIRYHREYGEDQRTKCNIAMLRHSLGIAA